jgi:predicted ATPase
MENTLTKLAEPALIRTPDQRLRVFISSTIQELSPEREIVRKSIERLQLIPVLFESGARPHPPQELYQAYLSQSHIFLGIYWQSYGWVAPGEEISGLEDEYQLAKDMPRLIYVKVPAPQRELALITMLDRIKNENSACYKYFSSLDELETLIANDIVLLLSERFESSLGIRQIANRQAMDTGHNLPQELTTFIGRDSQVASLTSLIASGTERLVTLTGPGGVGKTRLALKVASRQLDQFKDGVWLVELANLSDPSLIIRFLADALFVREEKNRPLLDTLVDHLYNKRLLLVLDNCEHLILEVTRLVEVILRGAPEVKVLATSREPLGVPGEIARFIPPLPAPELHEPVSLAELRQYDAVDLFVDRAIAVNQDFTLTPDNAAAVAQICARLDGIPLAIELAAARLRILSVQEIASRLEDRFRLLVGNRSALPRQRTLRALIDWSYDLLSEDERMLLRRLSVFSGGWTLESAEQVCSGEGIEKGQVLDLLTQLIDKSLVIPDLQVEKGRYQFLDTIHKYCQERLQESGEIDQFARKHAEYFMDIAEQSYGELWGPNQNFWLQQLAAEHDNLRSALESLINMPGQEELVLRLAGSLWRFWEIRGYISEGRGWLEHALAITPDADRNLRANAMRGAGILACQQGDYMQAELMHAQSLALFRELEFKLGIGRQLDALGEIAWFQGNYPKALEMHTESLAIRYEINDQEGVAASLENLGNIARDRGTYHYASELLEESLEVYRELGNELYIARSLNNLGVVAYRQCEYQRAYSLYEEALSIHLRLDDKLGTSNSLHNLGNLAKDQGDFNRAIKLYNECLAIRTELADKLGIAQATACLAEVAFFQGNYARAADLADESLSLFRILGVMRGIILSMQVLGFVAHYQGNDQRAISLANESLDLSIEIKSPRQIAYAKGLFGLNEYANGNLDKAMVFFQEALSIFREVDDCRNVAHILVNLARTAYRQGDSASSLDYLAESLSISRELEINWSLAFSLEIKGLLQRSMGEYQEAFDLFLESLQISVEQKNLQGIDNCLGALAGLAFMGGQLERAARLFAFTEQLREQVGVKLSHADQLEYYHFLDILRDQMDDVAYEAAWSTGASQALEQVLEELEDWRVNQPFGEFQQG